MHAVSEYGSEEQEQYSLFKLLSGCEDFVTEKTQLDSMGDDMGITVISTPKYHSELAGEGV